VLLSRQRVLSFGLLLSGLGLYIARLMRSAPEIGFRFSIPLKTFASCCFALIQSVIFRPVVHATAAVIAHIAKSPRVTGWIDHQCSANTSSPNACMPAPLRFFATVAQGKEGACHA
jgi:hypothetical protein